MEPAVLTRQQDAILWIILNRPSANAIDCETSRRLHRAFLQLENDPSLRAGVITGAGERFFSAGWDLKAASRGEAVDADHGPGGFAGLTELFSLTKPVIAAVNGLAVGGGFELALACDFIIAAEHAEFFLPEVTLGIVPDSGGIFRLSRHLPRGIALEMMMTGRRMNASEAGHWGLVNRVVKGHALSDAVNDFTHSLMRGAPLAQRAIKEMLAATQTLSLPDAFRHQREGNLPIYRSMLGSEDAIEGIRSFNERRPPVWQGH